jgi:hypothetical protein
MKMTDTGAGDRKSHMAWWLERVRSILDDFSDRAFQERAWFGKGPEETSANETICMLLDTMQFRHVAEDPSLDLTERQRLTCADFVKMLDVYAPDKPVLDDREVIDDPEWEKIRVAASKVSEDSTSLI